MLRFCWAVMGTASGKRMAAFLGDLVPVLRMFGELTITDETATVVCAMSAATIDRRLAPDQAKLQVRGRSHTKPGSLLTDSIPMRTWADWDDAVPGFARDRPGRPRGWQRLGIDSDNGSEFINHHLFSWCTEHEVTFTRSRSGNKNDGAQVEQKNWTQVRQIAGYHRYDTAAELELLNRISTRQTDLTNFVYPQQKLIAKERIGAKVIKKYDTAATPHRRNHGHGECHEEDQDRPGQALRPDQPRRRPTRDPGTDRPTTHLDPGQEGTT